MLKYNEVEIRISELHTQRVVVPAWEIPILAAIHGDTLTVNGEDLVDRDAPDAGDEFRRLATRYRNTKTEDGSIGIPYVASVYGQYGVGTEKLAQAIAAATVAATKSDPTAGLLGRRQVSSVGG